VASCRYCGIAHTNAEARCASCGAPKAASDIKWFKTEERKAAVQDLKIRLSAKTQNQGRRGLPAWGWVLLLFFLAPVLMPAMFMLLFGLFWMGWASIPLFALATFVGVQTGLIPWRGQRQGNNQNSGSS